MGKYCLLEKCGCEDAIYMDGHDGLYCRFGQRLYKISDLKECPGSSRQIPVVQTIDTVNSYQAGRADMKREIGEKVEGLNRFGTGSDDFVEREDMLAAIEEVK